MLYQLELRLLIEYNSIQNRFEIEVNFSSFDDSYAFHDFIAYIKGLYISFDPERKIWYFAHNRLQEIILWFEKFNTQYSLSDKALIELKRDIESYSDEIKFVRKVSIDESLLNKDVKIFDYQREGILWRLSKSSYLDSDDAGLGKSFQNIVVFSQLFKQKKIDSIVIITPNGLSYHWQREILNFVSVFKSEDIHIITNENKIQPFESCLDKKILIIPNHLLSTIILSYNKDFKLQKSKKKIQWKKVADINKLWNKKSMCLVVDESHEFKHSESIKTKALLSVKPQFDYRFLLSATPAINRFEDFYSQLKIVNNSIIPMEENTFKLYIANSIGNKWDKYSINSYKTTKVDEIRQKMLPYFLKRLKEDLPEMKTKRIIKHIYLELSPLQRSLYEEVCKSEISVLEEEFNEITLQQIINKLPIITEALDNPFLLNSRTYENDTIKKILKKWKTDFDNKFISLKSLLENYIDYQDRKVIVYGTHPRTLDMLFEQFNKYNPLIIHGSLKGIKDQAKYRDEMQHLFNTDPKHKLFILSSLTSSAGLNLQKGGSNIIVYELGFDGSALRQLIDRTCRISSIRDSVIEILNYPNTLDGLRLKIVNNRIELNDTIHTALNLESLRKLLNGRD